MSGDLHHLAERLRALAEHPLGPDELAHELGAIADELDGATDGPPDRASIRAASESHVDPYNSLVDAARDSMTLITRDFTYAATNKAFAAFLPEGMDEPVGKRVADVWGEESFETGIRPVMDRCFAGESLTYSLWLEPPNRPRGFFEVSCHPFYDDGGTVSHVGVITRDLTDWRNATDAAKHSEVRYRTLVENINEAIFSLDADGYMTFISPNIERLSGYPCEDYIGKHFSKLVLEEDLPRVRTLFGTAMSGSAGSAEFRANTAWDEVIWIQSSASPIRKNGSFVGITGTLSDTTASFQAQLALARSERKYRDIFHNIQDTYFEIDLDGTLLEISPSIRRINGLTREKLLGRNVADFFVNKAAYAKGMETLLAYRSVTDLELEMRGFSMERVWVIVTAALVRDQERDVFKIVGSLHDVTALKHAEAEIRKANSFLEHLVDTVPDPIYVKGEDHCWRLVNAAFADLLGMPKEKLYGKTSAAFFPKDQALSFRHMDQRAFDQDGLVTHEEEFWDTGGIWHVISTNKAVFLAPGESERLLLGVIRDITEQKRLEEMLWRAKEEAESLAEAKSRFLANMSHEIRTPLNGVIGMLQLMLSGKLETREAEYAATAMSSARGLLTVINDVLDLSKIEAGKMEIVKSRFDVREMVDSVIRALNRGTHNPDVEVHVEVDDSVPRSMYGGGTRIRQVLFNLVGNALKFTPQGRVDIEATWLPPRNTGKRMLLFCVSDTGVGIPDENVEHIFDDFAQVDDSFTREYQGAGLGLSIVRRLVELMRGAVTIMSEEGAGTTICFTVEADESLEEGAGTKAAEIDAQAPLPFRMALVVEDNSVNQILACRFLEKLGIEATGAGNGAEALKELERRAGTDASYDLVLMDIQMPVMDGLQATREIRGSDIPEIRRLPVVALTAHAMEGDRERFLHCGMDGYTAKPLVLEEFRSVLAGLVHRRS